MYYGFCLLFILLLEQEIYVCNHIFNGDKYNSKSVVLTAKLPWYQTCKQMSQRKVTSDIVWHPRLS